MRFCEHIFILTYFFKSLGYRENIQTVSILTLQGFELKNIIYPF